MPYMRDGAMKISDHHVRSPLLNISRACQTCHPSPEDELLKRVETIQDRTHTLMQRAALSLTDMMDAIRAARAGGATDKQLEPALELHRKSQWRLDFIAAENSMGFHAPQETARVLAEAIDYARQGQIAATSLRTPEPTPTTQPAEPVYGVTPAHEPPPRETPKP
jgi:nitrite reductase (cytochrome c-552)